MVGTVFLIDIQESFVCSVILTEQCSPTSSPLEVRTLDIQDGCVMAWLSRALLSLCTYPNFSPSFPSKTGLWWKDTLERVCYQNTALRL